MKKIIGISVLIALCFVGLAWANDLQMPAKTCTAIPLRVPEHLRTAGRLSNRDNVNPPAPDWEFIHYPEELITTYYDYMPGGYTHHPIKLQPEPNNGVYFSYMVQTDISELRRVYWGYVYDDESIGFGTITTYEKRQGFPGMGIHPASGDAIVSWHENAFPESELNTVLTYDDYDLMGIPGFWQGTLAIPQPDATHEYIWPQIFVGPSPTDGDVRIYNIGSNHKMTNACEAYRLMYIDVPNDDYVYGDLAQILNLANWSDPIYMFKDWADDYEIRPYPSFTVSLDEPGKVAFAGYAGYLMDEPTGNEPVDPGFYVWESYDYGETWNINDLHSFPMEDDDWVYKVENIPKLGVSEEHPLPFEYLGVRPHYPGSVMAHRSALYDGEGNLHIPTPLMIEHQEPGADTYSYWPYYMFLFEAEVVYKADGTWDIRNVPNLPGTDPWTGHSVPWTWTETDTTIYPWMDISTSVIDIVFHENFQHQAVNKENDWMVQVWNSGTELLKAEHPDAEYPTPTDPNYLGHPIIYISVSANNGETWSEPIEVSDIYSEEFPDFLNQITVYPYIAPTITDLGDNWGRIYMFYLNDNDYGSFIHSQGPQTGGQITYMSLKINFSSGNIEGTVTLDGGSGDVENVNVTVNNTTVNPDASGHYSIPQLLPGPYMVTASLDSYNDSTQTVSVTAGEPTTANFTLYQTSADEHTPNIPKVFSLSQNYPNPFSSGTSVSYYLPKPSNVKLQIYNVKGQLVKTLVANYETAGSHPVNLNAKEMVAGIYFYKLETDYGSVTKKMLLVR